MGQNSVYISIDEGQLDALWELEDQDFRDRFLEIEEDESLKRLDIAKIWDALHCTMTGVSASNPVEGNKLSESIVGVYPKIFDDDDYSVYVSVIENDQLQDLANALDAYDTEQLNLAFDAAKLRKNKVYPKGIWNDKRASLISEMDTARCEIRDFFRAACKDGNHVVASIL